MKYAIGPIDNRGPLEKQPMYAYVKYKTGSAFWDVEPETPEQKLYFATIERAWRDMDPGKITWIRKDAAEWFISLEEEMPSFLYAVDLLNLQSKIVKRFVDHASAVLNSIPWKERREAGFIQRRYQSYWTQETWEARKGRFASHRVTKIYVKQATFSSLVAREGTQY